MTTLKNLNREFESVSKNSLTAEDEAHLHFMLEETLKSMKKEDLAESSLELPVLISNLHHVILVCDTKSGIFLKTMEWISTIIGSFEHKTESGIKFRLLPLLTDALMNSNSKIDTLLQMIEQITFGATFQIAEPFLERLIGYTVQIIINDKPEHGEKIRKIALSVLVNLCTNNFQSLSILNGVINIVDLQKKVKDYGFMACKLVVILNDCGHMLHDADIRNFLKSALMELHGNASLDERHLRHLTEFFKDIAKRPNTKDVFQQYNFHNGIQAAIAELENSTDQNLTDHINGLFQVIQTILKAKNDSLKKLLYSILNFAMEKLKSSDCFIEAMETMTCVFAYEPNIGTSNFEFEKLQTILQALLDSNKRNPIALSSLFKLLTILATTFKINLIHQNYVNAVLGPLLNTNNLEYFNLEQSQITMYLQCIVMITKLIEYKLFEMKTNVNQNTNVHQLVAMTVAHGNVEQCALALKVAANADQESIADIITLRRRKNDIDDYEIPTKRNKSGVDLDSKKRNDRLDKLISKFEKIRDENKFSANITDIIDIYSNRISALIRRNESFIQRNEELSKEITSNRREIIQLQNVSSKFEEFWRKAESSIQTILKDKEKFEASVLTLRSQLNTANTLNTSNSKLLTDEKRKTAELEKKISTLEDELNEVEGMRLMVLNAVSKRKKGLNKEN